MRESDLGLGLKWFWECYLRESDLGLGLKWPWGCFPHGKSDPQIPTQLECTQVAFHRAKSDPQIPTQLECTQVGFHGAKVTHRYRPNLSAPRLVSTGPGKLRGSPGKLHPENAKPRAAEKEPDGGSNMMADLTFSVKNGSGPFGRGAVGHTSGIGTPQK